MSILLKKTCSGHMLHQKLYSPRNHNLSQTIPKSIKKFNIGF